MTIDEVEKIKTAVENKDYIVQLVNMVAKTMVEAFENLKIEDVNMFQLGYNKAIDDFADEFISLCDDVEFMSRLNEFQATTILELAEQLKAGATND